jgi:hypothetical protein
LKIGTFADRNGSTCDVRIFQNMNLFGEIVMVALMAICLDGSAGSTTRGATDWFFGEQEN